MRYLSSKKDKLMTITMRGVKMLMFQRVKKLMF